MPCTINNNTSNDLSQLENLTQKLVPFAQKQIGFNRPPTINFDDDEKNAANPLGRTAQYDPSSMEIIVFVTGRHIKDILRSIAHELVHHGQNLRGEFSKPISTKLGYAQNDEHLRGMEREAYEVGNLCFRDWEDGIKQQLPLYETIYRESLIGGESMTMKSWRIQELNDLLMEKFGYKPPGKKKLDEDLDAYMTMVDYQTGEEHLGEDDETLEEDEDDDEDAESSRGPHKIAQSVSARIKARIIRKNDVIFEQDEKRLNPVERRRGQKTTTSPAKAGGKLSRVEKRRITALQRALAARLEMEYEELKRRFNMHFKNEPSAEKAFIELYRAPQCEPQDKPCIKTLLDEVEILTKEWIEKAAPESAAYPGDEEDDAPSPEEEERESIFSRSWEEEGSFLSVCSQARPDCKRIWKMTDSILYYGEPGSADYQNQKTREVKAAVRGCLLADWVYTGKKKKRGNVTVEKCLEQVLGKKYKDLITIEGGSAERSEGDEKTAKTKKPSRAKPGTTRKPKSTTPASRAKRAPLP